MGIATTRRRGWRLFPPFPRLFVVLVVILVTGSLALVPAARAITLPAGFTDELVTGLGAPTALAFTSDGRLLITTQTGQIRVYQNGALVLSPALDLSGKLCSNSERGLLGIAVDPFFASNGYVYVYYTFAKFGVCDTNTATAPVNRVARFVLSATNIVDPASELVLIDNIPSPNG